MTTPDDETRDFVRRLFADPDEAPEPVNDPPEPTRGNVVPREGNTPQPPADDGMRDFARRLFNTTD